MEMSKKSKILPVPDTPLPRFWSLMFFALQLALNTPTLKRYVTMSIIVWLCTGEYP